MSAAYGVDGLGTLGSTTGLLRPLLEHDVSTPWSAACVPACQTTLVVLGFLLFLQLRVAAPCAAETHFRIPGIEPRKVSKRLARCSLLQTVHFRTTAGIVLPDFAPSCFGASRKLPVILSF